MKLYFVGAAHEVTGSCTILYACGKKIMIDCGMEQGENVYENVELPVSPNDIDAMLLSFSIPIFITISISSAPFLNSCI
jgi:metallo-beta-lactamase family protein